MNGILKRLALKVPPVRDYVARVHERRHDAEQQIKALAAKATSLEQEVAEVHERRHDAERQIKALIARGISLEQEVAELTYAVRGRERDAAIGLGLARKELATASSMISYAQNFEDVMIARAFEADHKGFYIDIGAAHPERLSVTCHFYNQGWSGINIEPSDQFYPLLCAARPRDLNLQCAVGDKPGRATFFEFPEFAENSTLEREVADRIAGAGQPLITHEVEVVRLADLCDRYAGARTIDFMKIDVEGAELGVLVGADWARHRPRLLIVEATMVNSRDENSHVWEPILIRAGYHKVWFDGLNNFYLREEDLDRRHVFRLPPNLFDGFEPAELVSLRRTAASLREQLIDREALRLLHEQTISDLESRA